MENIIIVDSREKNNKHILDYFDSVNQKYVISKLFVGDYSLLHNQSVCIDRKANVLELVGNITKQHVRFRNECIRAKENGIKLIVLIEEDLTPEQLLEWSSPRTKVTGSTIAKTLSTLNERYQVEYLYVKKSKSPETMLKMLLNDVPDV